MFNYHTKQEEPFPTVPAALPIHQTRFGACLGAGINQKSAFSFFCNISITLNHVKLEKQFSSDCSQAIFKSCATLQSNVLESISLIKKLV